MLQGKVNIQNLEYKGSCIYIIRNLDNGKVYIGSTKCYRKRMNEHRNDLIKQFHVNKHLQRSFNKGYTFECNILEKVECQHLILKEREYCDSYCSYNKTKGYNLLRPEETPTFIMTPEHQLKLTEARRLKGWDTSHLRTPEAIRMQAEGKYKKILIFKDGQFYKEAKSMIEAEEFTGVKRQNISTICRGIRKSVRGFTFQIDKNPTRK